MEIKTRRKVTHVTDMVCSSGHHSCALNALVLREEQSHITPHLRQSGSQTAESGKGKRSFGSWLIQLPAIIIVSIVISLVTACGGGAKVLGISVSPGNATAYAGSAQNRIVYKAEVEYSDNHRVTLTTGVQWQVQAYWVSFDSSTATATCTNPAPQQFINVPETATIAATATVEGQNYTASAMLKCF